MAANAIDILLEGSLLTVHRAGVFRYAKYYNYPVRRFNDFDLILFARGQATWHVEGMGPVKLGPGTVLLLPPNVANGTLGKVHGQAEHIGVHFDLTIENGANFFDSVPYERILHLRSWRTLYAQALRIAAEWSGDLGVGRNVVVQDLTRVLLVDLVRHYTAATQGQIATDGRVLEVLRRLDAEFASPLSVEEMAGWVGLSVSHLRTLFQNELGLSPIHALVARRLREARRLLLGTSLPVKLVAQNVGYEDPLYFSRAFREAVGQSPQAFRESAKNP